MTMGVWWFCATLLLAFPAKAQLVGSPQVVCPKRPDVVNATNVAMELYNQQTNDQNLYVLENVISAKTQVVAGTLYDLEVEVVRCEKRQSTDMQSCPPNSTKMLCHFKLWQKVWEDFNQLEMSQCTNA